MKTVLIILFVVQGFGVDDHLKFEYPSQEACDHAIENMFKTKDTNRGWHKGTQVVAFCAPEGAEITTGGGSIIDKLRENRRHQED